MGTLPIPAVEIRPGIFQATAEDLWDAAKAYARRNGLKHNYSTVDGVAPL